MLKKLVSLLIILMIILLAWVLISSTDVSVIINGEPITGPLAPTIGIWKDQFGDQWNE